MSSIQKAIAKARKLYEERYNDPFYSDDKRIAFENHAEDTHKAMLDVVEAAHKVSGAHDKRSVEWTEWRRWEEELASALAAFTEAVLK